MALSRRTKVLFISLAFTTMIATACWAAYILIAAWSRARAASDLRTQSIEIPIIHGDLTDAWLSRGRPDPSEWSEVADTVRHLQALQRPSASTLWKEFWPREPKHFRAGSYSFKVFDSAGVVQCLVISGLSKDTMFSKRSSPQSSLEVRLVDSSGWLTMELRSLTGRFLGRLPDRLGVADQLVFEEQDPDWSWAGMRAVIIIDQSQWRAVRQVRWGSPWDD